jgi:hypothetical protein
VLEVETPSFPSYLHVAYIQADGTVLNLVQPGVGSLNAYPPRSRVVIGDGRARGLQFKVSAPYGREMLIVLAGRSPIFPDLRPTQETEREFLSALRRALVAKPDPSLPDRDVTAGFHADRNGGKEATVIRLLLVCTIVISFVVAEKALAQEPSTEDVVKALVPSKKLRGPRGLTVPCWPRPGRNP